MDIRVLGTGCPKCNKLEKMVRDLIDELELDAQLTKVKEVNEIAKAGVMITPALVINGEVKFAGKLPSRSELKKIFEQE